MLFESKELTDLKSTALYLCNNQLYYADNCKYLHIKIETYFGNSDVKS